MRMIGAAVGAGALGALFSSTVAAAMPDGVDAASLTPESLAALPTAVQSAARTAVATGSSALFWVAAALAAVALVAALALPRGTRPDQATPRIRTTRIEPSTLTTAARVYSPG